MPGPLPNIPCAHGPYIGGGMVAFGRPLTSYSQHLLGVDEATLGRDLTALDGAALKVDNRNLLLDIVVFANAQIFVRIHCQMPKL